MPRVYIQEAAGPPTWSPANQNGPGEPVDVPEKGSHNTKAKQVLSLALDHLNTRQRKHQ